MIDGDGDLIGDGAQEQQLAVVPDAGRVVGADHDHAHEVQLIDERHDGHGTRLIILFVARMITPVLHETLMLAREAHVIGIEIVDKFFLFLLALLTIAEVALGSRRLVEFAVHAQGAMLRAEGVTHLVDSRLQDARQLKGAADGGGDAVNGDLARALLLQQSRQLCRDRNSQLQRGRLRHTGTNRAGELLCLRQTFRRDPRHQILKRRIDYVRLERPDDLMSGR